MPAVSVALGRTSACIGARRLPAVSTPGWRRDVTPPVISTGDPAGVVDAGPTMKAPRAVNNDRAAPGAVPAATVRRTTSVANEAELADGRIPAGRPDRLVAVAATTAPPAGTTPAGAAARMTEPTAATEIVPPAGLVAAAVTL